MRWTTTISAAILTVLTVGCSSGTAGLPSVLSPCELRAAGEGTTVRVRATYRLGFEESVLLDRHGCLGEGGFWLEFGKDCRAKSDPTAWRHLQDLHFGDEARVVVRGRYECGAEGHRGFGHENMYPCRIQVEAVEHFSGSIRPTPEP